MSIVFGHVGESPRRRCVALAGCAVVRIGNLYGPDATFLGVPAADLDDPASWAGAAAVILGAPVRRRHLAPRGLPLRAARRSAPPTTSPTTASRPHLALGVDPLSSWASSTSATSRCPRARSSARCSALEAAVATIAAASARSPSSSAGTTPSPCPTSPASRGTSAGAACSVLHFDAHADTGDTQLGSLHGHGTPMRRLIESGACRGDRFVQIGLRGYWPEPETLAWMAEQGMRSFEMTEIVARGLRRGARRGRSSVATDGCDAVFVSVDVDVVDPGSAPGTGTPEPGGLSRASCSTPCGGSPWSCPSPGIDVVEVSPPYDHAEVTAYLANRVVLEALSGHRLAAARAAGHAASRPRLAAARGRDGALSARSAHRVEDLRDHLDGGVGVEEREPRDGLALPRASG